MIVYSRLENGRSMDLKLSPSVFSFPPEIFREDFFCGKHVMMKLSKKCNKYA